MGWIALFAVAFSLSLDAFAVATVAGITLGEPYTTAAPSA
jgi:putative Mn2+ efflux pump MntP